MNLMPILLILFLMGSLSPAYASKFCDWKINVLNTVTNEERVYRPKSNDLTIHLPGFKGFPYCRVLTPAYFDMKTPLSPKPARVSRVEIICFTAAGDAVNLAGTIDTVTGGGVEMFKLIQGPILIGEAASPKQGRSISASGSIEFTVTCQ